MSDTDRLEAYRARRDFSRTPEPVPRRNGGERRPAGGGRLFTLQKHAARRLHFDLRLEHEGVLLSWAIARGPSLDPAEKRLAVRTEDHPLDYATFEGTIPKGEYGGGTVMLWDRGTWAPEGDVDDGLRRGKLSFRLEGQRISGGFALVRLKPRKGERIADARENWILVKERDDPMPDDPDPVENHDTSVASGRTMSEIAADVPHGGVRWTGGSAGRAPARGTVRGRSSTGRVPRRSQAGTPRFIPPQLATLVEAPPAGPAWLHEIKYDGYRIVGVVERGRARIYTRSGKDWTDRFPEIAAALGSLAVDAAVVDGEAVAFDEDGRADFSTLQAALEGGGPIAAYLFDLMHLDGDDRDGEPLVERKAALARILAGAPPPLLFGDHMRGDGPTVFERACELGAEGIVSKRADSPYRSGRGRAWLKAKCVREEEVVVGGYTPSAVAGKPFASLLVGTFENGSLVYRGRVGSGFEERVAQRLLERLERLRTDASPFDELPRQVARTVRPVRPELVAVVRYREITPDGVFRHPSYRGLREDKPARSVSRSRERGTDDAADRRRGGSRALPTIADRPADPDGPQRPPSVRLTSPDKVLFPATGLTKQGLADYFVAVAPKMLRFVANHPLSLVRCPEGRRKHCFFQKHHTKGLPEAFGSVEIAEAGGRREPYLVVSDVDGLVAAAQIGALELHVWGAPADAPERPDRMVLDLDPDEGLAFADVREAAREVRDLLADLDLPSFPLVTGGKGIHVVVPLGGEDGWDIVKPFARAVAATLARARPDRYLAKASRAARKGRIFVDWLRNARGATAIAPYSPRAREAATVATPVRWDELPRLASAGAYTVETIPRRIARLAEDPWDGYEAARTRIGEDRLVDMERRAAGRD